MADDQDLEAAVHGCGLEGSDAAGLSEADAYRASVHVDHLSQRAVRGRAGAGREVSSSGTASSD